MLWGKAAELVGNSCQKGHRLIVEGRIQIRNYEAKDGSKRWVTEIVANGVEFVERKADKSEFEQFGQAVPFDEDIPF